MAEYLFRMRIVSKDDETPGKYYQQTYRSQASDAVRAFVDSFTYPVTKITITDCDGDRWQFKPLKGDDTIPVNPRPVKLLSDTVEDDSVPSYAPKNYGKYKYCWREPNGNVSAAYFNVQGCYDEATLALARMLDIGRTVVSGSSMWFLEGNEPPEFKSAPKPTEIQVRAADTTWITSAHNGHVDNAEMPGLLADLDGVVNGTPVEYHGMSYRRVAV